MAIYDIDEEVLLGRRAFAVSQAAWNRAPVRRVPRFVTVGWYDTVVDAEGGPFALVDRDAGLDDLVGEIIKVSREHLSVFVYVIGSADLEFDFGLARRAFLEISVLANERLPCVLEVV